LVNVKDSGFGKLDDHLGPVFFWFDEALVMSLPVKKVKPGRLLIKEEMY